MRLRSSLGLGVVVSCTLTTLSADPGALASTARPDAAAPGATVVRTQPSATVGGLPASTQDGRIAYIPSSSAGGAPAPQGRAATPGRAVAVPDTGSATGFDVSWPNCNSGGATATLPASSSIAVVGVDDGHPFSQNPCLQAEAAWAAAAPESGQYMVLDSPIGWTSAHVQQYADHGPAGDCAATDYTCQSFNWGYNAAIADVQYANQEGATSPQWWLDVELPATGSIDQPGAGCYAANLWVCDTNQNSVVIQAAVAALEAQGKSVGVYSTQKQWGLITGGLTLGLPIWIAGYDTAPATYCDPANAGQYWFSSGTPTMIQSAPTTFDPDTDC